MKNELKIIGITLVLLTVGLSGCVIEQEGVLTEEEKERGDHNGKEYDIMLEGKILYTSGRNNIHLINPDGINEIRLTEGSDYLWSPDGTKIAYIPPTGCLHVLKADGTLTRVTGSSFDFRSFQWSPDSNRLLLTSSQGIFTVYTDGSNLVKLNDDVCWRAVFSPNGRKIAYFSGEEDDIYLYVMNNDGTGKKKLVEDEIGIYSPDYQGLTWSPDGAKIAYVTGVSTYVVNADGTNEIMIDPSLEPVWSPDGKKLAYWKFKYYELYVANDDGTGKKIITSDNEYGSPPSWSPDGRQLVFNKIDFNIYIANVDGSGIKKLMSGKWPQWSPAPVAPSAFTNEISYIPQWDHVAQFSGRSYSMDEFLEDETGMGPDYADRSFNIVGSKWRIEWSLEPASENYLFGLGIYNIYNIEDGDVVSIKIDTINNPEDINKATEGIIYIDGDKGEHRLSVHYQNYYWHSQYYEELGQEYGNWELVTGGSWSVDIYEWR